MAVEKLPPALESSVLLVSAVNAWPSLVWKNLMPCSFMFLMAEITEL